MIEPISTYLTDVQSILDRLNREDIARVIEIMLQANEERRRVFIVGNGGSAATASHFACDLSKGASVAGLPRFGVIALTDNVPLITAWANDTDYENVFAQQMVGLLRRGDVIIGISGSGNSVNVLNAIRLGNQRGATTVGLTGFDGGALKTLVDVNIHVPSFCMEQVEDVHMVLTHLITTQLRNTLQNSAIAQLAKLQQREALDTDMLALVKELTEDLKVTIVSVGMLDETHSSLVLCAASPIRYLGGMFPIGTHIPLQQLPTYQHVLDTKEPLLFQQNDPKRAISHQELHMTLPVGIKSGALLPLRSNGDDGFGAVSGVVTIGEMRAWARAPFTETKLRRGVQLLRNWANGSKEPHGEAPLTGQSNGSRSDKRSN